MDPRDAACAAPEDDGWKSMWRGLPLAGKAKGPGSPRSWGWSRRFGAAEHGATALEFAILAPAFLAIVFGIINLGIGLFGIATMHAETEDAARCYAVKTTVCTSAATTASYASSHYQGPIPNPTFTATTNGACHSTNGTSDGYEVTATATYSMNMILTALSIPVSTAACFP